MEEVLAPLQQRIIDKVAALKYVDENWGQLDYYSANPPVQWPCCLIDIGTVVWKNMGNRQQQGVATITLYVANLKLTNTSGRAPAGQRNKAWEVHRIINEVHQAVHQYKPYEGSSLLYRKTTARLPRDDGIQQYVIIYECTVTGSYELDRGLSATAPGGITIDRPPFPEG